jgi:hypothetical protein
LVAKLVWRVKLVTELQACQGARDGLLATRAAVKFLLGLVALPGNGV